MSDIKTKKRKTWKNPLAVWGAKGGNHEVATPEWKNPHQIWRDTKAFKVPTNKIGRFHYEYKSSNHGEKIWNRLRWWPTRRTILLREDAKHGIILSILRQNSFRRQCFDRAF